MFLAGIDEAGYGPLVGPLAVGWSLFHVPDPETDLWRICARSTVRRPERPRQERRLWVDDSKRVHSGPLGRRRLERTVAAFRALTAAPEAAGLEAWLSEPPAPSSRWLRTAPWLRRCAGPLCPSVAAERAQLDAGLLDQDLGRGGCAVAGFGARAVPAAEWNALTAEHGKAGGLFLVVAEVLRHLLRRAGVAPLRIECDRHGARRSYRQALERALAPDRLLVHAEERSSSLYTLEFGRQQVQIRFAEGADGRRFPVALASLAAKQTRERLMDLWNAWFASRLPGIRPTKGYASDGKRWLAEAGPRLSELGLEEAQVRRYR
ncbi:MAG: hypothetical protein D6702_08915 [Planctomycetota bacterium]|nr:MAG: hypothetical protein D6702_08915 [Planctomycetota bacterium]